MFSYHFDMHLFRAKTFLCRPNSQTQRFRYRSIKQNKRICYRLSKQNKTTLKTMSSNYMESTDPSTGNVCFFRFGTMSFKLLQPAIPYNDSCLASRTINSNFWEPAIPCIGNHLVPRLGTVSFKVWETEVLCNGNPWFPGWEPVSSNLSVTGSCFAMVTCGSHVGNCEFQPLGTGSSLP